jgi:hypothetical protein
MEAVLEELPPWERSTTETEMRCCCGKQDCVFLKRNYAVLDTLENDVHNAARMGQVCSTAFLGHLTLHATHCRGGLCKSRRSVRPPC